jgi:hypothetical protein
VTSIGGNAFRYCHGLTSITIPAGVTDIGITAFSDCNSLLEINVETDNPAYTSEDGILFNRTRDTLLQCPAGKQGDYIIPDSVTCIGESAFSSCSALTSIAIPDSVTNIPEDGDKNLCYPGNNSLNRIFRCKALRAIHVAADNPVYASHDGLLFDKAKDTLLLCPCGKQGACVIPDSVTRIGNSAFSSCNSLTSITIPDSVTAIDRYVFFNCTGLTSIRIPAGVTDISLDAFNNCDLKIEVAPDNPVYASVDGVILNKEKTAITHFPSDRKGPYAVPDGVTVIGDYNFGPCFGLMSVTIPASVTHIVENCFFFSSCGFASGDLTLTLLGHTPPSLSTEESPVSGLSRDTPVFVPAAAVETYRLAKGWNKFSNIRPIPEMGNETYR